MESQHGVPYVTPPGSVERELVAAITRISELEVQIATMKKEEEPQDVRRDRRLLNHLVMTLHQMGNDPNAKYEKSEQYDHSPLTKACKSRELELVQQLIDIGADVNYKTGCGRGPLQWLVCNMGGYERPRTSWNEVTE